MIKAARLGGRRMRELQNCAILKPMRRSIGIRAYLVILLCLGAIPPVNAESESPQEKTQAPGPGGIFLGAGFGFSGLAIQDSDIGSGLYPFTDTNLALELRIPLIRSFGIKLSYHAGFSYPIPMNTQLVPRGINFHELLAGLWLDLPLALKHFPAEALELHLAGGLSFPSYDYTYLYLLFPTAELSALFRKKIAGPIAISPFSLVYGPSIHLGFRRDPGISLGLGIHLGILLHL